MSTEKDAKLKALKLTLDKLDKTYGKGRIGIGSFDDMNDFDNIKLYGR